MNLSYKYKQKHPATTTALCLGDTVFPHKESKRSYSKPPCGYCRVSHCPTPRKSLGVNSDMIELMNYKYEAKISRVYTYDVAECIYELYGDFKEHNWSADMFEGFLRAEKCPYEERRNGNM